MSVCVNCLHVWCVSNRGNTHENASHYSLTLQSQHVNDTIDIPWRLTMLRLSTRLLTKWYTCLPMCIPAYLHDCLHAGLPPCLPAWMPACMPTCRPASLPTCLPAWMPACLPAWMPAYIPACLHTCMPTYLPVCLSDPPHPPQFTHKKKCEFVGWCVCVCSKSHTMSLDTQPVHSTHDTGL